MSSGGRRKSRGEQRSRPERSRHRHLARHSWQSARRIEHRGGAVRHAIRACRGRGSHETERFQLGVSALHDEPNAQGRREGRGLPRRRSAAGRSTRSGDGALDMACECGMDRQGVSSRPSLACVPRAADIGPVRSTRFAISSGVIPVHDCSSEPPRPATGRGESRDPAGTPGPPRVAPFWFASAA
jgi:hypothetical protein